MKRRSFDHIHPYWLHDTLIANVIASLLGMRFGRLDDQHGAGRLMDEVITHAAKKRPASSQARMSTTEQIITAVATDLSDPFIPLDPSEAPAAEDEKAGLHLLHGLADDLLGFALHNDSRVAST
jgi:hypothetical protein